MCVLPYQHLISPYLHTHNGTNKRPANPPLVLNVHAALFDVDGTIVDSSQPIFDFWKDFAKDKPDFDAQYIYDTCHGWRTFDVIAKYAPQFADPDYVNQLEGSVPDKFGSSAKEIPGAIDLVNTLLNMETGDDKQRIAVGTSGTYDMASKWFNILGLTRPEVFITAEDVTNGKPDPEPYLMGRNMLGYGDADKKVVVFEDAPAGVKAGHGAGCFVVGIASTFDADFVKECGADAVVKDLRSVKVTGYNPVDDTFQLHIDEYHHVSDRLLSICKQF